MASPRLRVWATGCLNNSSFLRVSIQSGLAGWQVPMLWDNKDTNGDQHLYMESNTLNNMLESPDADNNSQLVMRFNRFNRSGGGSHGTDTSGILGNRAMEVYNNIYSYDTTLLPSCNGGTQPLDQNWFFFVRGGSGRFFQNVLPVWNGTMVGVKPGVGLTVWNLQRNSGGFPCGSVIASPGAGWPAPHQVGWGWINGTTNMFQLPGGGTGTQDPEPTLFFANTGGDNYDAIALSEFNENDM
jgi:hypothetical protein